MGKAPKDIDSAKKEAQQTYIGEKSGCGIGKCTPRSFQCCADIRSFTGFYAVVALTTQVLIFYLITQVTTLEKQFGLSSTQSGFLLSANDIGYLVVVLLASHFGRNAHRPVILGALCIAFALFSIVGAVPHFVMSAYDKKLFFFATKQQDCDMGGLNTTAPSNYDALTSSDKETIAYVKTVSYAILVFAFACQGAVKGPRLPLVTTYIDDHVPRGKLGIYIGVVTTIVLLGVAIAFFIGSAFSNIYVTLEETTLTPSDPRWVGAWWLGFILIGVAASVVALPMLCFPRTLRQPFDRVNKTVTLEIHTPTTIVENVLQTDTIDETATVNHHSNDCPAGDQQNGYINKGMDESGDDQDDLSKNEKIIHTKNQSLSEEKDSAKTFREDIKDFPRALFRLAKNQVFMCLLLGDAINSMTGQGRVAYQAKYLENHFRINASVANMYLGLTMVLGATLGTITGGIIVTRFKLSIRGCLLMIIIAGTISQVLSISNAAVKCEQANFYGYNITLGVAKPQESLNESNKCASESSCLCGDENFLPVCGSNGNNYLSPCHAGCTSGNRTMFFNCSCVGYGFHGSADNVSMISTIAQEMTMTARPGYCQSTCRVIHIYLIILFCYGFIALTAIVPRIVTNLRLVSEQDRSLAVGVNSFVFTLFGSFLSPILYGVVIDSACVLWHGSCRLYDIADFRKKFHIYIGYIGLVAQVVYTAALVILLCSKKYFSLWKYETDKQIKPDVTLVTKVQQQFNRDQEVAEPIRTDCHDNGANDHDRNDGVEETYSNGFINQNSFDTYI